MPRSFSRALSWWRSKLAAAAARSSAQSASARWATGDGACIPSLSWQPSRRSATASLTSFCGSWVPKLHRGVSARGRTDSTFVV
eukprot:scaffold73338_cov60-Phaeocystis_antarctica.AAC.5